MANLDSGTAYGYIPPAAVCPAVLDKHGRVTNIPLSTS